MCTCKHCLVPSPSEEKSVRCASSKKHVSTLGTLRPRSLLPPRCGGRTDAVQASSRPADRGLKLQPMHEVAACVRRRRVGGGGQHARERDWQPRAFSDDSSAMCCLLPWQQRRELCATADGAGEKCRGEGGDEGGDGEVWERCGVGRGHGRVTMPVCRTEGPEGGGLRGGRGVLRAGSGFLRVLRAGSEFFLSSSSGERNGFPMLSL